MNGIENTSVTYVVSTTLICHLYYRIDKKGIEKFASVFFVRPVT